jgi:hypothetical protein
LSRVVEWAGRFPPGGHVRFPTHIVRRVQPTPANLANLAECPGSSPAALAITWMVEATAQSGTAPVSLFRAVSHAEYADVINHGTLRAGPNSYAHGKFFAESGSDALQWGSAFDGPGNFRVLEVGFTKVVADRFMRFNRLDNIGPARFARFDELNRPTIRLWSGSP